MLEMKEMNNAFYRYIPALEEPWYAVCVIVECFVRGVCLLVL